MSLILPRTHRPPEPPPGTGAASAAPAERAVSVLVVEDDDEVAELVLDLLEQLGHQAIRVSSAAAALGALGNGRALDVLFTDVLLPGGLSGLDLAREAARRRPDLAIVLTTGYGGEQGGELAESGFPVLRKPYDPDQLGAVLDAALDRAQSEAAPSAAG